MRRLIRFGPVATLTALVCSALAVLNLLLPELIMWLFGVEPVAEALLLSRRAGVLFGLIAGLLFVLRTTTDGVLQRRLAWVLAGALLALGLSGSLAMLNGSAGPGMLLAITTEWVIAGLFLQVARAP